MLKILIKDILQIYAQSIMRVFPFSALLAVLFLLLEPNSKPTFTESTDWLALFFFIMGLLAVFFLHACIVYQFQSKANKATAKKSDFELINTLQFSLKKIWPLCVTSTLFAALISIGTILFILPGFFVLIMGSLSLFLIVLKNISAKEALTESYHLILPHWFSTGVMMVSLTLMFTAVESLIAWVLKEQVVFSTLFFVGIRGLLWPLWYATMMVFLREFSTNPQSAIADFLSLKPWRRNRKQKSLHIAPNQ
jgi:hypothetical protein